MVVTKYERLSVLKFPPFTTGRLEGGNWKWPRRRVRPSPAPAYPRLPFPDRTSVREFIAAFGPPPVEDPSTGLSESARGNGRGHANAYSADRGQNTATRRYLRQPRIVLQRIAATLTGGFAVLIDHPAAVLGAAAIISSPLASEFLVNGKALRVTEVDFAVGADIRGHEALSLGQTVGWQRLSNSRLRGGSLTR